MKNKCVNNHSAWAYVIGLYFPFGIMQGMQAMFPTSLFKLLGFSNQTVGLISGLGLIAIIRFLYTPWLDGAASKRTLSFWTLILGSIVLLSIGALVYIQLDPAKFVIAMIPLLLLMIIIGSAHETAADGYYIRALNAKQQAQFIGIKTAVIRIGLVSVHMGLMLGATKVAAHYGAFGVICSDKTGFYIGYAAAYVVAAVLVLFFLFWNRAMMPVLANDEPVSHTQFAIGEVFKEYFNQRSVFLIIAVIFLYRIGDGFLAAMKVPFYLDPDSAGGLGVAATTIPYYSLLTDMPWMIIGGVLGGYVIKWRGIKKTFLPLACCISLPNISYILLAIYRPGINVQMFGESMNLWLLGGSCLESLGYGLAFSGVFYYMHITATESGRNKTSILAISFALMNAGWYLPGMLSGFVQAKVGYVGVFTISCLAGWIVLFIIPHVPEPLSERCGRDKAA
ncbi:MAG: hypothetical protein WC959_01315 [Kiritimatiellales bacterium]